MRTSQNKPQLVAVGNFTDEKRTTRDDDWGQQQQQRGLECRKRRERRKKRWNKINWHLVLDALHTQTHTHSQYYRSKSSRVQTSRVTGSEGGQHFYESLLSDKDLKEGGGRECNYVGFYGWRLVMVEWIPPGPVWFGSTDWIASFVNQFKKKSTKMLKWHLFPWF